MLVGRSLMGIKIAHPNNRHVSFRRLRTSGQSGQGQKGPTAAIDGKPLVLSHRINDVQRLVGDAVAD
jgi:hypothetical protein